VRIVGHMRELEDELCAMTTNGFIGENSPNRADAAIWALTELFPGMVNTRSKMQPLRYSNLGIV
jgi:phage terminase large subunit-like protein